MMRNLFKKKKPARMASAYVEARLKATAALGMFSTALTELNTANKMIEEKKQQDLDMIKYLEQGINIAEKEVNANLKVIVKLAEFVPLTPEEEGAN
jgi:hypothetical protein